jgi:3-oxoacyl-[acyl-carrier protein] reductase
MRMRNILVTGAGTGIGLEIVKSLLKNDCYVVAHYNKSKNKLLALKKEYQNLKLVQQNFSSPHAADKLFNKIKKIKIDGLVNNAALMQKACEFEKSTDKIQKEIFNINFFIPYQLCQNVISNMVKSKWGRIINISSIGAKYGGNSKTSLYTLSKMTLEGLTEILNKNYADSNVLSNTIRVGVTDTGFHKTNSHKDMKSRVEKIPLKRMAKASEIAEMVNFLISEKGDFISGQKIAVAGGE